MFSRNKDQTIIALFIIIFTFLLLFNLKTAQQTGDGLYYALSAKTGRDMFHPHHLLYTPVVRVLYLAISSICESSDVIFAAQIHNIIWAVVTVLSFYFVVKHLLASSFVGVLAAIFLLVTRGFWQYSTQVEVYVPATGCIALLVAIIIVRRNASLTITEMVVISLLLAMSVFYHQTNVLFCIPLGYYLIATQGRKARVLVAVLSLAGIIVLSAYILVLLSISENRTVYGFLRFCLAYALYPDPRWGNFENFSVAGIKTLLNSQVWNLVAIPWPLPYVLESMLALLSWNIMQIVKHAVHDKIRTFLLVWVITYFIFFLWWLPVEREFFVTTLFPMLLLAFITVKDGMDKLTDSNSSQKITIAIICILIVIVSTLNFRTVLDLHRSRGFAYREARKLAVLVPQECAICAGYTVVQHLRYHFDREGIIEAIPLLCHYQHEPLSECIHLEEEEKCIAISLSYVTPAYTFAGFSGYSNPSEWLEFMGWLFGFEYDSKHRLVACREFEVITDDEGGAYIILSSRMEVGGLSGLFQILDNQISEHLGEKANPFQSWLYTVYSGH